MTTIWFISDTHFNHSKVLTFEASSRSFSNIEQHDEELIKRWNDRVRPKDLVWHLGDVYLGKDPLHFMGIMKRLNGRKNLVRGNHDTFPTEFYAEVFKEVYGVFAKYDFVMSHVPLHQDSVERWGLNVHGHLHSGSVKMPFKHMVTDGKEWTDITPLDPRYYCVSVEQHDLAPVSLEAIRNRAK